MRDWNFNFNSENWNGKDYYDHQFDFDEKIFLTEEAEIAHNSYK